VTATQDAWTRKILTDAHGMANDPSEKRLVVSQDAPVLSRNLGHFPQKLFNNWEKLFNFQGMLFNLATGVVQLRRNVDQHGEESCSTSQAMLINMARKAVQLLRRC
jgi:hypothetical protein